MVRKAILVISVNIFVLAGIAMILNFSSVTAIKLFRAFSTQYTGATPEEEQAIKDMVGLDNDIFAEHEDITFEYHSYLGWRRSAHSGRHINIDSFGIRATKNPNPSAPFVIALFGGSTMWGTGVSDEETIASHLAAKSSRFRVVNYGESGYVSRQSLNLLIRELIRGQRFDVVVFYDGVNDVRLQCQSDNAPPFGHGRELRIRQALEATNNLSGINPEEYRSLFANTEHFIQKVKIKLEQASTGTKPILDYNCHSDADKAKQIEDSLFAVWHMTEQIADAWGAKFVGLLQPVKYVSKTDLSHLRDAGDNIQRQYDTLYPMLTARLQRERASGRPVVDISDAVDFPEKLYFDYAHLNSHGNRYVADRIFRELCAMSVVAEGC